MTAKHLHLLEPQQQAAVPDAELAAKEHDAALVVQITNATIALCQHRLRDQARTFDVVALLSAPLRAAMAQAASNYRSAADLLEGLRS